MSNRTEPPRSVVKVWGAEHWLLNGELYACKRLYVKRGYRCSYHRHILKDETFVVEWGHGWALIEGEFVELLEGVTIEIPPGTWHTFWCPVDSIGLTMLEISTHHDDADVERRSESGPLSVPGCDAQGEARNE